MKKLLYSMAGALLLTMGSCDSLDLAPIDYAGAGNFWQNEGQVSTFMTGLHANLRNDYTSPFFLGEVRGGTLMDGTSSLGTSVDYSYQITQSLTLATTGVSNWNGYYARILQVNHFIDQVSNNCGFLSEETRNTYLAQAHGLRAYYYFMLYKTFGGVPLETDVKLMNGKVEVSDLYKKRSSAEDVVQFIKDEINESEKLWGSNTSLDRYIWSKYATLFLKADIYLWSAKVSVNDYEKAHTATGAADLEVAKKALNEIIASGKFKLMDNFADIFAYGKKRNDEIILAMPFDRNETTNSGFGDTFVYSSSLFIGSFYDEDGNVIQDPLDLCGSGWFKKEYRESLVKSFDKTDSRRAATFLEYYSKPNEKGEVTFGVSTLKYLGHVDSGTRYYDSDVILYRYADVILMMAEVENGLNNPCASYVNQIRERAYGANYSDAVAYKDGSFAENELAILKERDKEFVAEGKRWFDLRRMQDASKQPLVFSAAAAYPKVYGDAPTPVLDKAKETHKLLWPINVSTLTADPELTQTWGYDEAEGN